MASKYVCRTCLRTLRTKPGQLLDTAAVSRSTAIRTFAASISRSQEPAPAESKSTQKPFKNDVFEKPKLAKSSPRISIADRITKVAPQTAETYHSYGATEYFLEAINDIIGYDIPQRKTKEEVPKLGGGEDVGVDIGSGKWYSELNLVPTFNTWAQLAMLHFYILTTRIRCLPAPSAKVWSQNLTDHFFREAETRMEELHAIHSRSVRSKYLKDLFLQWRGILVSYDEGLVKGDTVLASAVWRNLFSGRDEVDPVRLAMVVAYLRREVLRCAGEDEPMTWARFGNLKSEEHVVLMKSHFMDKPLPAGLPAQQEQGQAKA